MTMRVFSGLFGVSGRGLAAFHEAGHAAALHAMNERIGVVSINGYGGGVTHRRHSLWLGTTLRRGDVLRVAIAGPLIESKHGRSRFEATIQYGYWNGHATDGELINKSLNGDSLGKWEGKTKRLLWGYGREIGDLAQALLDCGEINGDHARQILRGSR